MNNLLELVLLSTGIKMLPILSIIISRILLFMMIQLKGWKFSFYFNLMVILPIALKISLIFHLAVVYKNGIP